MTAGDAHDWIDQPAGLDALIDRLVGLSRLRVLRPALRQILTLIATVRNDD